MPPKPLPHDAAAREERPRHRGHLLRLLVTLHRVAVAVAPAQAAEVHRQAGGVDRLGVVGEHDAARDHAHRRVVESRGEGLERARQEHGIRVDEDESVALGGENACGTTSPEAAVERRRHRADAPDRSGGDAVVDEHDVVVGSELVADRRQALLEHGFVAEPDDDDADAQGRGPTGVTSSDAGRSCARCSVTTAGSVAVTSGAAGWSAGRGLRRRYGGGGVAM